MGAKAIMVGAKAAAPRSRFLGNMGNERTSSPYCVANRVTVALQKLKGADYLSASFSFVGRVGPITLVAGPNHARHGS